MMATARERPILFSGPMVRAILAGIKSQTRRVIKPQPVCNVSGAYFDVYADGPEWVWWEPSGRLCNAHGSHRCPYGVPGERLWVRETFCPDWSNDPIYRADDPTMRGAREAGYGAEPRWRPSIHMPRALSRITLEITGIRVEHLQSISDADRTEEGGTTDQPFGTIWRKINTAPGVRWEDDPWVWVLSFQRVVEHSTRL